MDKHEDKPSNLPMAKNNSWDQFLWEIPTSCMKMSFRIETSATCIKSTNAEEMSRLRRVPLHVHWVFWQIQILAFTFMTYFIIHIKGVARIFFLLRQNLERIAGLYSNINFVCKSAMATHVIQAACDWSADANSIFGTNMAE